MLQATLLTMFINKNLKILQNSIIKDASTFQTIIVTALINNNVVLIKINILILVIYHEIIKDSV